MRLRRYGPGARWYDVLSFEHPVYRAGRVAAIEALGLHPGDTVLDVACGTGLDFPMLLAAVGPSGQIVGVDASAAMLNVARRRVAAQGWSNVTLVLGDAAQVAALAGSTGPYDVALFTYALSVIADGHTAWDQSLGLVRDGGRVGVVDLALPTGWATLLSPLARFACFTGGVDLARRPWRWVESDTELTARESLRGRHLQVAVGVVHHGA